MDVPVLHHERPLRTFRMMFSDGSVVDVTDVRDDSVLRGWVLQQKGNPKAELMIVGSTELPAQDALL